jgi:Ca2+:H+ antiporter
VSRKSYAMFAAIPVAVALELLHAPPLVVFGLASFALIPAAFMMTRATEELAERAGPGVGGILNVTFGNGPELILAFFSLIEGLHEVVKASLVGSVIGNVLLVLGASMLVGGWRREKQTFDRTAVQAYSGMLLLAVAALLLPTLVALAQGTGLPDPGEQIVEFGPDIETASVGISVVLLLTYVAGMFFALKTHRRIFNPPTEQDGDGEGEGGGASTRGALIRLGIAGVLVAVTSEVMVGSVVQTANDLRVTPFFLGVIVMAIVGNAAEHSVAVLAGYRDRMHLAMTIALGSATQIALVVAPLLVLLSFLLEHPMALVFNGYEVGALAFAVIVANYLTVEGESNWFEGLQLLALYLALAVVFFVA